MEEGARMFTQYQRLMNEPLVSVCVCVCLEFTGARCLMCFAVSA